MNRNTAKATAKRLVNSATEAVANKTRRKHMAKRLANAVAESVHDRQAVADHTARFLQDYEAQIQAILSMPSGRHGVNPERLEEWIAAQQSAKRREIARALSQHIIYITHEEVIDRCRDLVTQFYTNYLPQQGIESPRIALFTHRRGKSGYMIALLFYYWAQQLGYPVPTLMTNELYPHLLRDPKCVIAFVDDMSYSGSQLMQILSSFAILPAFYEKTGYPKLWVGFVAITEKAQQKVKTLQPFMEAKASLTQVSHILAKNPNIAKYNIREPPHRGRNMLHMPMQNPFTVYASRVIPSLRKQMGLENYVAALMFFNSEAADSIVYFDHKVADSPSTFMKVLVFGPVPAKNVDINFWIGDLELMSVTVKDEGIDGDSVVTQFKPFIDGCPEFTEEQKALWGIVDYNEFLTGLQMSDEPVVLPGTFENAALRCPQSWYKTMFNAEGGAGKVPKTRRRKTQQRKTCNRR